MNKALLSSKNTCWGTPKDFFEKLDEEFHFVLDPAATEETAKCAIYYTPETDGLLQSWDRGGAVFCNPPYGREIGRWVKKAFEESQGGVSDSFTDPREDGHGIFSQLHFGKSGNQICARAAAIYGRRRKSKRFSAVSINGCGIQRKWKRSCRNEKQP